MLFRLKVKLVSKGVALPGDLKPWMDQAVMDKLKATPLTPEEQQAESKYMELLKSGVVPEPSGVVASPLTPTSPASATPVALTAEEKARRKKEKEDKRCHYSRL